MATRESPFVGEPAPTQAQQAAIDRFNSGQLLPPGGDVTRATPPIAPSSPAAREVNSHTVLTGNGLSESDGAFRAESLRQSPYAPTRRRLTD